MNVASPTHERIRALLADEERRYLEIHPKSAALVCRLSEHLPGGDTRTTTWYPPYPMVIDSGDGCVLRDADGNELIDAINNYTSLVHGHRFPSVVEALAQAADRGIVFATPLSEQNDLAALLVDRVRSVDRVRFTNSGTEANMLAARIARAFTARSGLAVAEHSYHGSWPDLDWEAEAAATTVFPSDDIDRALELLDAAVDLAAIFIEPVLGSGGVIPLPADALRVLRDYAEDRGALFVLDEVMSFRLGYGGAQESLGITPDLTTFGKVIGGGIPTGAVGGRADVMAVTEPNRGQLHHSGTFNGNRLSMVAGCATLEAFDAPAVRELNQLGESLAGELRRIADESGRAVSVTGTGSLLNVHAAGDVHGPREAARAATSALARYLHLALINEGVFIASRGEMCMSTPMSTETVARIVSAMECVIEPVGALVAT